MKSRKEAISSRHWMIESGRVAALLLSFILVAPWALSALSRIQPILSNEISRSSVSIDSLRHLYPLLVWLVAPMIISSCVASLISSRLSQGGELSENSGGLELFLSFFVALSVIIVSYWTFNYWISAAVLFLRQGGDGTNLLVAFRAWLVFLGGGLSVFSVMLWVVNRLFVGRKADRT
jgi:hypothetical protein